MKLPLGQRLAANGSHCQLLHEGSHAANAFLVVADFLAFRVEKDLCVLRLRASVAQVRPLCADHCALLVETRIRGSLSLGQGPKLGLRPAPLQSVRAERRLGGRLPARG